MEMDSEGTSWITSIIIREKKIAGQESSRCQQLPGGKNGKWGVSDTL